MPTAKLRVFANLTPLLVLSACGGGGGGGAADPPVVAVTDAQRSAAAQSTAQSNANCTAVQPFYWEIGRSTGMVAGATVGGATPTRTSTLFIASASKMLYAGYVAERRAGVLTAADIQYLNFRSGYTSFGACQSSDTVGSCANDPGNNGYTAANVDKFFYGGAHMQQHAAQAGLMNIGALDNAGLAAEMNSKLGISGLGYSQPQPAGGGTFSAAGYANFLQRVIAGNLRLRDLLGSNQVHTNPTLYPNEAGATPSPPNENWNYSVGHWVETDPAVGDGAFSSPGAFGFYPWIDATKTLYGVLARASVSANAGVASAYCGRLIRKAWVTGQAVP